MGMEVVGDEGTVPGGERCVAILVLEAGVPEPERRMIE